jgi:hypothetical protein
MTRSPLAAMLMNGLVCLGLSGCGSQPGQDAESHANETAAAMTPADAPSDDAPPSGCKLGDKTADVGLCLYDKHAPGSGSFLCVGDGQLVPTKAAQCPNPPQDCFFSDDTHIASGGCSGDVVCIDGAFIASDCGWSGVCVLGEQKALIGECLYDEAHGPAVGLLCGSDLQLSSVGLAACPNPPANCFFSDGSSIATGQCGGDVICVDGSLYVSDCGS